MGLDTTRMELWIEWELRGTRERLHFALRATSGPRNGRMREFFELPLAGRGYLKEPFDPEALAHKVLEMLDAADEGRDYNDSAGEAPAGERTEGIIKPRRLGRNPLGQSR